MRSSTLDSSTNITHGHVTFFTHNEYGTRALLTDGAVNPRDQLGKMGIDFHTWAGSFFHRTITTKASVRDEKGAIKTQTIYFNRGSVIKYLRALGCTIKDDIDHSGLVRKLNEALLMKHQNSKALQLRHAGRHNSRLLNSLKIAFSDFFRGKFFSWLYQKTIGSLSALKKRFIFAKTERDYFEVSEVLAKRRFKEAVGEPVPAYKAHVEADAAFQAKKSPRFQDVPVTSKANYIQPNFLKDWALHRAGKYPAKQKVDTSTGTTGKPAVWARGEEEVRTVKKSLKVAAEIDLGQRRVHYINAFALGPWATGMTAYELMRESGSVIAVGPDIGKILDELDRMHRYEQHLVIDAVTDYMKRHKRLARSFSPYVLVDLVNNLLNQWIDKGDTFDLSAAFDATNKNKFLTRYKSTLLSVIRKLNSEKSQFVIAGYPPFLKDLVDKAAEQGIDFKQYHARGVVGGQAISEALRDKLMEGGFSRINSSYGASDLDINIGVETDFEITLRKELEKNPAMQRELFGPNKGLPMIFHFDPFNYHIEATDEDDLLFTCNRSDRSSPRIRYNLGDKGRVFAASDIEALLVKHGVHHIKPRINLPFVFVWGRDSAVAYRGCKVSFTDLERGITNLDPQNIFVKRAFYAYHDAAGNEKFDILIELKNGAQLTPELYESFARSLLLEMSCLNQDLRSHFEINNTAALPTIRFFRKGTSPISDADGHRKQVLVFKDQNLPQGYQFPADEVSVMVDKDAAFAEEARTGVQGARPLDGIPLPSLQAASVGHGSSSPRLMRHSFAAEQEAVPLDAREMRQTLKRRGSF
jgi:phenylacetate-coenzyme A ligase PaaK-like adenylate-forming protein